MYSDRMQNSSWDRKKNLPSIQFNYRKGFSWFKTVPFFVGVYWVILDVYVLQSILYIYVKNYKFWTDILIGITFYTYVEKSIKYQKEINIHNTFKTI